MRLTLAALLALAGCTHSDLPQFEKTLAAHDSATLALGAWCANRRIAQPPAIRALADRTARRSPAPAVRTALGVSPDEPLAYRHVRLACGDSVLSVAHNWYVPARLTPDMNRMLEATDTPFGKVVASLGFRRERLASKRGRGPECPKGTVLSHRAVLRIGDGIGNANGRAISLVIECYTAANFKSAG